jgi:hypothetical protein
MSLKVDGFGVACGVIFLAGGVWELLALQWPLAPILLILLGGYLLRKAVWQVTVCSKSTVSVAMDQSF